MNIHEFQDVLERASVEHLGHVIDWIARPSAPSRNDALRALFHAARRDPAAKGALDGTIGLGRPIHPRNGGVATSALRERQDRAAPGRSTARDIGVGAGWQPAALQPPIWRPQRASIVFPAELASLKVYTWFAAGTISR